ncbi:MAG: transglutaminase-like domain-containing protein [Vicinamibacteria bacterium]
MKIRPGRFLSVAIVLTWVSLLSVHLWRSYSRPETSPLLDLASNSSPEAELTQRAVFYRGARIGYLRERFTPLPHGFRAEQTGELTLNLLGRERRVEMEGSAETGAKGELRRFSFRLSTSSRRSPFETLVLGEVERDELRLTIRSGGSERIEHRIVVEPIVLPLNLYYSLAARGLTPGDTYRLRLFDPMTLSEGDAVIAVKDLEIVRWGGREEEAHRLLTTFAGLTTTAWINDRGEVLQEETPLGWTLRKEAPGSSIQALDGSASPDMVLMSAVPAIGFSDESSDLSSAVVELRNFPEGFAALDGGRQKLQGTRLAIAREAPPYHGELTLSEEERTRALAYDAFIQTNDPAIRDLAGRLAVGETDAEKAEALSRWVYDNLAKSPTLSLPSATEILKQRVGDCNEHTVLFTALSRAAGIPTRIATGLTYTGGQFYYHAWPEVFVGRWLALDPTLGQFPADPLHLRLLVGGIESQYEVLNLLGRGATVEVLEAR